MSEPVVTVMRGNSLRGHEKGRLRGSRLVKKTRSRLGDIWEYII